MFKLLFKLGKLAIVLVIIILAVSYFNDDNELTGGFTAIPFDENLGNCSDTNEGKNIFEQGEVKLGGLEVQMIDSCVINETKGSLVLMEVYCQEHQVIQEEIVCPEGFVCREGACVE